MRSFTAILCCYCSLFSLTVYAQEKQVVILTSGGGSGGTFNGVTTFIQDIPAHGMNFTLWNSNNVFNLTVASTYADGSRGDWYKPVSTVNAPEAGNAQDIYLRPVTAGLTQRISGFSYGGGVTGPATDFFGTNSYDHWEATDNDMTTINYTGPWFYYVGNQPPAKPETRIRPHH